MNITPDQIVDRIKLKRQLINWRLIAIVTICMLIVSLFTTSDFETRKPIIETNYIARILVDGMITHDTDRLEILKDIAQNNSIKALIVHIDSSGGTVVGGESLYNAIRKISSSDKPVVAVMGDTAASAAYMTAIACDYLIAHQGTLTGSIGVLSQSFEVTDLAHKLGIKFNSFKSSPLKGGPIPTEEVTPEMRAAMNDTITDIYNMFFDMVADRRSSIPREKLVHIADGRVYTGRQAVENGLVDAIGNEDTAIEWLKSVKKIDSSLKVRDIQLVSQQSKWRKILESSARVLIFLENSIKCGLFSFL